MDRVEDVHRLSFGSDTLGTVLMLETVEHVRNPLGPDLFRLLGEEPTEEEQARYPVPMLHNAYARLLQKDEEIARLQHELKRLHEAHGRGEDGA